MDYRSKLYRYPDIYDHAGTDQLFAEAVRGNVAVHYRHCREYRRILKAAGFRPENIAGIEDLHKVPPIPTLFFKSHPIKTVKDRSMLIKATSSGTQGMKSQMGFDAKSLLFGLEMAVKVLGYHGLFSAVPANYMIMGYQPTPSNQTVITKTQGISTCFAPALHREYALVWSDGEYRINFEGLRKAIKSYAASPFPVRIIGFPSYTWFFLKELEKEKISIKLPQKSLLLLGGGWKQFYKEEVDKAELYRLAKKTLGMEEGRIREFFGAVEHPSLYCTCKNHHFHVPVYSRVIIRDVKTLEPVGYDKPGLLNLITPMAESMPLVSVITDDLGILHRGGDCGCGIDAPYFEIIGRVGMEGIKTCAAGAQDLMEQQKGGM